MERNCDILLVSGSLRAGSTNTAMLASAAELDLPGIRSTLCTGMELLPHFNPDDDAEGQQVDRAVLALRSQVKGSDALLFCTPEYAGALPGALKNLLEWTVGDAGTYGKPVGYINASGPAAPTGGKDAHDSLRKVFGYVGAEVIEAACVRIPVTRGSVSGRGTIEDPDVRGQIADVLLTLARKVQAGRERPD